MALLALINGVLMGRIGTDPESSLWKKLWFRLDSAADSRRVEFTTGSGNRWEAEFSLHSGRLPQSPRLMVIFRCLSDPSQPQRYTLAPPGASKVPREAVEEFDEEGLRELLSQTAKL
jgi:hypothetical protein